MYIYLHLPFCSSICSYCDFSKLLYDDFFVNNYLDILEKEVKERYKGEKVVSIYIGGGTPTCLNIKELEKLLDITKIFCVDNTIEFTVESNVESLDNNKIELLKKYGVNRISLGVQSFDSDILKELNRHHDTKMVIDVIQMIKKNHIDNISIDYIYGIKDDIDLIKNDLDIFLKLNIPHISCYSLIIEDGTVFGIHHRKYIDDEVEKMMYVEIERVLEEHGYVHYEISNYAKEGYQSIHNLNYWNNGEYYGFGLSAVSYLDSYRIINTKNLTKYLDEKYSYERIYDDESVRMSNELILGLRKMDGISICDFEKKYHLNLLELYDIRELLHDGLLESVNGYLKIPKRYIYLSNDILIHFL